MEDYKKHTIKIINDNILNIRKMILDNERVKVVIKRRYDSVGDIIHDLYGKIRELKKSREIIFTAKGGKNEGKSK